ncbi:metalloregulator ArsR/SmtB family transcription factor [Polaromonas sp. YR568]|uniref:ArsR/SmtB family transcription factor n=1 Tax=Polaromonas sp. YR568 TaxID=1855301 RepID=UPI003137AF62
MKTSHPVLNPERLREAAAQAVSALKVLANEDRLLLLCQLSQGELCVSEMEEILGIRQPTLSQQLSVLRKEGTVTTRREGKNIYYRVADAATLEILALLYRQYCPEGEK